MRDHDLEMEDEIKPFLPELLLGRLFNHSNKKETRIVVIWCNYNWSDALGPCGWEGQKLQDIVWRKLSEFLLCCELVLVGLSSCHSDRFFFFPQMSFYPLQFYNIHTCILLICVSVSIFILSSLQLSVIYSWKCFAFLEQKYFFNVIFCASWRIFFKEWKKIKIT